MGRGTYPGCPWHFKVGQLGYRGLLYGVFDRFLGSVWVPPMGPFRLDMGGYAQDTWMDRISPPGGCPWQLTCSCNPHPDHHPGCIGTFQWILTYAQRDPKWFHEAQICAQCGLSTPLKASGGLYGPFRHTRAVPGTSKLVNLAIGGCYMAFLTGFGGRCGSPHGTFSARYGWIRPRYMGETGTHTEGMSLATRLPIHPPPRWPSWPV